MKLRHALIPAAALLCGLALWEGNTRIETAEYEIASPRLPESFDGYRIAQVSDLHGARLGRGHRRLLEAVRRAGPDLIAVTGDLADVCTGEGYVSGLVPALVSLAPVVFSTGNHEGKRGDKDRLCAELASLGATVLRDESVCLERSGGRILLAGAEDEYPLDDVRCSEALAQRIRAEEDGYLIMLVHRNDRLPRLAALGVDLVLSGHAHGGLIRLPFTDGLIGPGPELLPAFTSGEYRLGGGCMVVSRGLGNHSGMVRVFNRPHLPVIVLRRDDHFPGAEQML